MCLATFGIELLTTLPPTWTEVEEGSQLPGKAAVWSVERYDRSVPGTVTWTVKESNFSTPGALCRRRSARAQVAAVVSTLRGTALGWTSKVEFCCGWSS
jgi:hypothetical protein